MTKMNKSLDYLTKVFPRKGNSWYKGLNTEKIKILGCSRQQENHAESKLSLENNVEDEEKKIMNQSLEVRLVSSTAAFEHNFYM